MKILILGVSGFQLKEIPVKGNFVLYFVPHELLFLLTVFFL